MNIDNIKLAVFDMAGTTIDEGHSVYQSVSEALGKIGIDIPVQSVFEQIGGMNKVDGIRQLVLQDKPDSSDAVIESTTQSFIEILQQKYATAGTVKEMDGASELFAQLKEQGIVVALDTGYTRTIADMLIRTVGWDEKGLIDMTVASEEVDEGRPSPLMIQKIMRHFGITDPSKVMKVGDTKADILEGINAGCKYVVGMSSVNYTADTLRSFGATHVIQNLTDILDQVDLSAS